MAGSLYHITADDGTFKMDTIENLRDAREALEECHQLIALLLSKLPQRTLIQTCKALGYPVPKHVPVLEPERWGAAAGITAGDDVPASVEALEAAMRPNDPPPPLSAVVILDALARGFSNDSGTNALTMGRVSGALRTASRILDGGRV